MDHSSMLGVSGVIRCSAEARGDPDLPTTFRLHEPDHPGSFLGIIAPTPQGIIARWFYSYGILDPAGSMWYLGDKPTGKLDLL